MEDYEKITNTSKINWNSARILFKQHEKNKTELFTQKTYKGIKTRMFSINSALHYIWRLYFKEVFPKKEIQLIVKSIVYADFC